MTLVVIAILLMIFTVVIHLFGTYVSLAHVARVWQSANRRGHRLRLGLFMARLVTMLLLTHLLEVGLWSSVFWAWGLIPDFPTALYYSLTSYTTVGYGDVLLPESTRLLGPIEALLGVLMLGWSTALIVAVVNRLYKELLDFS